MWGEAIRHAVYLLNRVPTKAVQGATPYEAWTKEKPQVDYLRVFGYICYMKIPNVHVKKLDNKNNCVVHLGREAWTKTYHVYDLETKSIHVCKDVIFDETKGWKWNKADEAENLSSALFVLSDHKEEEFQGQEGEKQDGGMSTPQPVTPISSPSSAQS